MTEREAKRRSLGRGLDALLGSRAEAESAPADVSRTSQSLPIEFVHPSRFQPRRDFGGEEFEELVISVRENGILQPILVRPDPDKAGSYQIVAGERRWRAAQQAQLHEVPVVIRELDDAEALEAALVENLQRKDLSPLEEAEGYRRLMDEFSHTQEQLAQVVGKSRSHVANMLRLLGLPAAVKALLQRGDLTAGHARALLNSTDPEALAQQVVLRELSVRQTEKLSQAGRTTPRATQKSTPPKGADTLALEHELSEELGLSVTIRERARGGEVVIRYATLEQLDEVLGRLGRRSVAST